MKYHPAWERKGALAHAAVRMDLEDVMLMKHASLYKDKCWVISVPGSSQGKRTHRNRKERGDLPGILGGFVFHRCRAASGKRKTCWRRWGGGGCSDGHLRNNTKCAELCAQRQLTL